MARYQISNQYIKLPNGFNSSNELHTNAVLVYGIINKYEYANQNKTNNNKAGTNITNAKIQETLERTGISLSISTVERCIKTLIEHQYIVIKGSTSSREIFTTQKDRLNSQEVINKITFTISQQINKAIEQTTKEMFTPLINGFIEMMNEFKQVHWERQQDIKELEEIKTEIIQPKPDLNYVSDSVNTLLERLRKHLTTRYGNEHQQQTLGQATQQDTGIRVEVKPPTQTELEDIGFKSKDE